MPKNNDWDSNRLSDQGLRETEVKAVQGKSGETNSPPLIVPRAGTVRSPA